MGGRVFLLENRVTIGRTAENDIHLRDTTVSKQHAVAYLNEGQPIVEDLGSFNGTFVNGRSVKKTVLRSGDTLREGGNRYAEAKKNWGTSSCSGGPRRGVADEGS